MWKNIVEPEKPQAHFTLGTEGYKHTLKEYIILTGFLLQQWLQERSSILHYSTLPVLLIIK
jgi:hypothetical protein